MTQPSDDPTTDDGAKSDLHGSAEDVAEGNTDDDEAAPTPGGG